MNTPDQLPDEGLHIACYTQGVDPDMKPNGNFDTAGKILSLPQALAIVRALSEPRHEIEPCAFCPPTFGIVDWGNVCMVEGGIYWLWTARTGESTKCQLAEAVAWVEDVFSRCRF